MQHHYYHRRSACLQARMPYCVRVGGKACWQEVIYLAFLNQRSGSSFLRTSKNQHFCIAMMLAQAKWLQDGRATRPAAHFSAVVPGPDRPAPFIGGVRGIGKAVIEVNVRIVVPFRSGSRSTPPR